MLRDQTISLPFMVVVPFSPLRKFADMCEWLRDYPLPPEDWKFDWSFNGDRFYFKEQCHAVEFKMVFG